jgi:prepilin-type N-terminal cleavage/methylation domain-containing protein
LKDNKGFSLIEIMVVLVIVAIIFTGTVISIRLLNFADTEYCANEINSEMGTLRMETMSKGSVHHYLVIEWDSTDHTYYMSRVTSASNKPLDSANWQTDASTIRNRKKLASSKITIATSLDGTIFTDITVTNSVILISFVPSSGAFESTYKQIRVTSIGKTSTVVMVGKTGKFYVG